MRVDPLSLQYIVYEIVTAIALALSIIYWPERKRGPWDRKK